MQWHLWITPNLYLIDITFDTILGRLEIKNLLPMDDNLYEIKGQLELVRNDIRSFAKHVGWVIDIALLVLVYIAFKLS